MAETDHLAQDVTRQISDMQIYITYESVLFGIVVWDWLVCLGQEYRHVWTAKSSVIKGLYLMSRYISLILTSIVFALNYLDQPLSTCNLLVRFNCAAITVIQAISLAVLTQRAYYVSMRNKTIVAFLSLFIIALVGCGITHAVVAVEATPGIMEDGHGTCRVRALSHWKPLSTAFFALPVVGHTVATIIVLVQTYRHLPHNINLRRLLVLDGALYLLAVDAVGIVQLIFFTSSSNHQLAMMNAAALLSLTSVFCCRFILHLRTKSDVVTRHGTSASDWTGRPDWTNNFGAPLKAREETNKLPSGIKAMWRPKHRLSRFSDTGVTTILTVPELRIDNVPPSPEQHAVQLAEVQITQDVICKIDNMQESEYEAGIGHYKA